MPERNLALGDILQLDIEARSKALSAPLVGVFDAPLQGYVINEEWASHLIGVVHALAEYRAWVDDYDERSVSVQEVLKFLGQAMTLCDAVENCLTSSTIINAIESDVATLEAQTATNTSDITTIETTIDNITYIDTSNQLPAMPDATQLDSLCGASYRIANELNTLIQDTITDASTITIDEFLTASLGIGGFDGSFLKLFWDYIVANSYAGIDTDVASAIDTIAEHFYTNELDIDATKTAIDADTSISDIVQACYIGAIDSVAIGKVAMWAFIGGLDDTNDCSSFALDVCETYDFTANNYSFYNTDLASQTGSQECGTITANGMEDTQLQFYASGSPTPYRTLRAIGMRKDFSSAVYLKTLEINYDYIPSTVYSSAYGLRVILKNGTTTVYDDYASFSVSDTSGTNKTRNITANVTCDSIELRMTMGYYTNGYVEIDGSGTIRTVQAIIQNGTIGGTPC